MIAYRLTGLLMQDILTWQTGPYTRLLSVHEWDAWRIAEGLPDLRVVWRDMLAKFATRDWHVTPELADAAIVERSSNVELIAVQPGAPRITRLVEALVGVHNASREAITLHVMARGHKGMEFHPPDVDIEFDTTFQLAAGEHRLLLDGTDALPCSPTQYQFTGFEPGPDPVIVTATFGLRALIALNGLVMCPTRVGQYTHRRGWFNHEDPGLDSTDVLVLPSAPARGPADTRLPSPNYSDPESCKVS